MAQRLQGVAEKKKKQTAKWHWTYTNTSSWGRSLGRVSSFAAHRHQIWISDHRNVLYIFIYSYFIFSLCKTVEAAGMARLFIGVAAAILRHHSSSASYKAIQIHPNVCRCLSCQFECEYISSSDEVRIQTINHQAYFISRFSASLFFFRSVSGSWRNYEAAGTI